MIKIIMKKQVFFTKLSFRMLFCFVFGENFLKSSHQEVFYKKGFLEIMQNSQENTWARVSFSIKLQAATSSLPLIMLFVQVGKRSN